MKSHPADVWKSASQKPKIVIGTTAHAAFDESTFPAKMTEEDIVKFVDDSLIGENNLTEIALNMYGKTREGKI